jgi:hypothetical protein
MVKILEQPRIKNLRNAAQTATDIYHLPKRLAALVEIEGCITSTVFRALSASGRSAGGP